MKNYKELNEKMMEMLFPEGTEEKGYISFDVIDDITQLIKDLENEGYKAYKEDGYDRLVVENKNECL